MATDLTRIGEKARKEPGLVFTSLYHHIYDVDNLRACYETLDANKATGVDGVTKEEYGRNLEENLRDLSGRLRRMGYRPGPKRRSYIPKSGSEKGRPLGISNLEDKIVEEATKRTLEPIYEITSPIFDSVVIHLDRQFYGGGRFTIEARNNSVDNVYIQSATLNGAPLSRPWFYHREFAAGGRLVLELGPQPNEEWGSRPEDAPPSMSSEDGEGECCGGVD